MKNTIDNMYNTKERKPILHKTSDERGLTIETASTITMWTSLVGGLLIIVTLSLTIYNTVELGNKSTESACTMEEFTTMGWVPVPKSMLPYVDHAISTDGATYQLGNQVVDPKETRLCEHRLYHHLSASQSATARRRLTSDTSIPTLSKDTTINEFQLSSCTDYSCYYAHSSKREGELGDVFRAYTPSAITTPPENLELTIHYNPESFVVEISFTKTKFAIHVDAPINEGTCLIFLWLPNGNNPLIGISIRTQCQYLDFPSEDGTTQTGYTNIKRSENIGTEG